MKKISKNISYREATRSTTANRRGIDNTPTAEVLENMMIVADACFQPLREWYGKPIRINSFYRSPVLNKAIGGSKTSDHCFGRAIDMDTEEDNGKLFEWCKENLIYDQLIWEYGDSENPDWIHISFRLGKNRRQTLRAKRNSKGRTYYEIIE